MRSKLSGAAGDLLLKAGQSAAVALSLVIAVAGHAGVAAAAPSAQAVSSATGIRLSVDKGGSFEVTATVPQWTFGGTIGAPLADLSARAGRDPAGPYREVGFRYATTGGAARAGAIRVYDHRPVVVFSLEFLSGGQTTEVFPAISGYPRNLHHLTYTSVFGGYSFEQFGADGPWVFFDEQANTFILSPASHFMNASLFHGPHNELASGLVIEGNQVPPGFVHDTALVIEPGINRAFETWGRFLTDLTGKKRPANDADFSLKYLGYWTDHGARYYYRFEESLGYPGTLLAIRDEFRAMGIRLGYVQLDSWFYPKGRAGTWKSTDHLGGGTYLYEASRELFPDGLAAFQRQLGLPLIVHNRWIDGKSPYRRNYAISGNVSIDPKLWTRWMRYLRAAGVRTYEQDWLSGPALAERDHRSGESFMDLMAKTARREGIALQYCMPLPRHFLQGTRYSNLFTIRTSGDRFRREHWKAFLFNGRLASALGEWPWSDVFMSSETSNLLLSNLSGSIVGVGDAIGSFDRENLLRAVRPDGVIVKADDSIAPLDRSFIEQASGRRSAVIAATHTRHRDAITSYVFAFAGENRIAAMSPAELGYEGAVYAYNYFEKQGAYLQPPESMSATMGDAGVYWIVVPVGPSGVGFLGDAHKFVSNGKNRVADLRDTGTLAARIIFAQGERRLRMHGFSLGRPAVSATRARVADLTYDADSGRFEFDLLAARGRSAVVTLRAPVRPRAAHAR